MGKYFCNPVNVNYRYQFDYNQMENKLEVAREAADPSLIYFQGKYYIFASMTLSVWVSEDMAHWECYRLPENLPLYDYAPDVRAIGDYVYFCASKRDKNCSFYRTKDIINGPYEEIPGTFDFWDPSLFRDQDGSLWFYWGCSSMGPIWGVEMEPETMRPKGEKRELIQGDPLHRGYERMGEDHCDMPLTEPQIEEKYQEFLRSKGICEDQIPAEAESELKGLFAKRPFIEGAWMNQYHGKYYLQYACPGTEFNIYGDGVYEADHPLGPFVPAQNNPYSYKPGGFCPGAGHGSTAWDCDGNLWHTSTMRISVNYRFERRVGIWPAGFDQDGELFCNQRYGDWPYEIKEGKNDPWKNPEWYLLSYGKKVRASSFCEGKEAEKAVDEDIQTWWRAVAVDGQWIEVDLEDVYDVRAVQINFADDKIEIPIPGKSKDPDSSRYIEERDFRTRWLLEGSVDGNVYSVIEDKTNVKSNLPHDLVVREEGMQLRYIRLTILEVPYKQQPCISGLRVFGIGKGEKPARPVFLAARTSDLDMEVEIQDNGAVGYNILWGHAADKLYHSYMIFGTKQRIGALVEGQKYYVRVDAFNENGITEGEVMELS